MSSRSFSRSEWIFCLFLVLLTAKVYGEVFTSGFIRFDDPRYITKNSHVLGGMTWDNAAWALTAFVKSNWHPLTLFSHLLDVTFYGVAPGGHHATSLLFHSVNSVLLFAVLRAATGAGAPSAFVAVLFAVHPTHVESVAWVSERKDVLSTFFGLLATAAYIAYTRRGGAGRYLAVVALFFCSLAAKPMLVTLPFLFLLLDYWPLERLRVGRPARRILLEKLPLLAVTAAVSGIAYAAQTSSGAVSLGDPVSFPDRFANAAVSYVRYVGKTLWPTDLTLLYPHPNLPGGTPWQPWQVLASAATLIAVSAAVIIERRRPYLAVGWFWFLGTLVPVIGIVQAGTQGIADRYTYVPCIGLTIALAWGGRDACRRLSGDRSLGCIVAAGAIVALLAVTAQQQVGHWRNSITIFEHSLAIAPGATTLRNNLANELYDRGRTEESIEHYRRILEIDSEFLIAHRNLGNALRKIGRPYEGMEHALIGHRIDPKSATGQLSLGEVVFAQGLIANAELHFRRAVELDPGMADAQSKLGALLLHLGRTDEAIVHLRRAAAIEPDDDLYTDLLEKALLIQRVGSEP